MADSQSNDEVAEVLAINSQVLLDTVLTLLTGEELMFVMDVPYIPEMDTPVLMVQAGPPAPPADYIFNADRKSVV